MPDRGAADSVGGTVFNPSEEASLWIYVIVSP